jgi:hypothetical protein
LNHPIIILKANFILLYDNLFYVFVHVSQHIFLPRQAEREEHQQVIEEKQSRALLKNTLDPILSQLTKASDKTYIKMKSQSK